MKNKTKITKKAKILLSSSFFVVPLVPLFVLSQSDNDENNKTWINLKTIAKEDPNWTNYEWLSGFNNLRWQKSINIDNGLVWDATKESKIAQKKLDEAQKKLKALKLLPDDNETKEKIKKEIDEALNEYENSQWGIPINIITERKLPDYLEEDADYDTHDAGTTNTNFNWTISSNPKKITYDTTTIKNYGNQPFPIDLNFQTDLTPSAENRKWISFYTITNWFKGENIWPSYTDYFKNQINPNEDFNDELINNDKTQRYNFKIVKNLENFETVNRRVLNDFSNSFSLDSIKDVDATETVAVNNLQYIKNNIFTKNIWPDNYNWQFRGDLENLGSTPLNKFWTWDWYGQTDIKLANKITFQTTNSADISFKKINWFGMKANDLWQLIKYITSKSNYADDIQTRLSNLSTGAFQNINGVKTLIVPTDTGGDFSVDTISPPLMKFAPEAKTNWNNLLSSRINIDGKNKNKPPTYTVYLNPNGTQDEQATSSNLAITFEYIPEKNDDNSIKFKTRIKSIVKNGFDLTQQIKVSLLSFNDSTFDNVTIDNGTKNLNDVRRMKSLLETLLGNGNEVVSNVPVIFKETETAKKFNLQKGLANKLKFSYGYVLQNDNNLNDVDPEASFSYDLNKILIQDTPIKIPDDPKNKEENSTNKQWGGRWLVKAPMSVQFTSNKTENELLMINGKRVDVLNLTFSKDFRDMRTSLSDNKRIPFNPNDANKKGLVLDDTNSHAKNEYIIDVLSFEKGSNNEGTPIAKYRIIYFIDSLNFKQTFKWFAWDPKNNPDQKNLITKELIVNGQPVRDKNGNILKNPKYDPDIDVDTGTKSQIIYIPITSLASNIRQKLFSVWPNLDLKNLGVIAQASVLGKGALRNLEISSFNKILLNADKITENQIKKKQTQQQKIIDDLIAQKIRDIETIRVEKNNQLMITNNVKSEEKNRINQEKIDEEKKVNVELNKLRNEVNNIVSPSTIEKQINEQKTILKSREDDSKNHLGDETWNYYNNQAIESIKSTINNFQTQLDNLYISNNSKVKTLLNEIKNLDSKISTLSTYINNYYDSISYSHYDSSGFDPRNDDKRQNEQNENELINLSNQKTAKQTELNDLKSSIRSDLEIKAFQTENVLTTKIYILKQKLIKFKDTKDSELKQFNIDEDKKLAQYNNIKSQEILNIETKNIEDLKNLKAEQKIELEKYKLSKPEVTYFRVKLFDKKTNQWIKNPIIEELKTEGSESQNAYMSEEGIWLISASANGIISNVKVILIDEKNQPNNYFLGELSNKQDNSGVVLSDRFENFWETTLGHNFLLFLQKYQGIDKAAAKALSYESLMKHYLYYVNMSWKTSVDFSSDDKDKYDSTVLKDKSYINVFEGIHFDPRNDFNGLTDTKILEEQVRKYINSYMKIGKISKYIEDKDWKIKEWNSAPEAKKRWLENLAKVKLRSDQNYNSYHGLKLTLIQINKYENKNFKKELYFKNSAWHVYNPPIDLSKLNIENKLNIDISEFNLLKKPFYSLDQYEEIIKYAIKYEIVAFVKKQLDNYKNTTGNEIVLNKDIRVENLNLLVEELFNSKKVKTFNLILTSLNANLLNKKTIEISNEKLKNELDKDIKIIKDNTETPNNNPNKNPGSGTGSGSGSGTGSGSGDGKAGSGSGTGSGSGSGGNPTIVKPTFKSINSDDTEGKSDDDINDLKPPSNPGVIIPEGKKDKTVIVKEISRKEILDSIKFDLSTLTPMLLQNNNNLETTSLSEIQKKVKSFVAEAFKSTNLKYGEDYRIFALNSPVYWMDLITKEDNPNIKNNPKLLKLIKENKEFLARAAFVEIGGEKTPIPLTPLDTNVVNMLKDYYNKNIELLKNKIKKDNSNDGVFSKMLIIIPTKKSKNFAYGYVFNTVDKNNNAIDSDEWIKGLENENKSAGKGLNDNPTILGGEKILATNQIPTRAIVWGVFAGLGFIFITVAGFMIFKRLSSKKKKIWRFGKITPKKNGGGDNNKENNIDKKLQQNSPKKLWLRKSNSSKISDISNKTEIINKEDIIKNDMSNNNQKDINLKTFNNSKDGENNAPNSDNGHSNNNVEDINLDTLKSSKNDNTPKDVLKGVKGRWSRYISKKTD